MADKKPKVISAAVLLILLLCSFGFHNTLIVDTDEEYNQIIVNKVLPDATGHENDDNAVSGAEVEQVANGISGTISTRGNRGFSDLYENNSHGGSWLDSFKDGSGIGSVTNLVLDEKSEAVSVDFGKKYIRNSDFESGTVGQVPDDWTYHVYNTFGAGTSTTQVKQDSTKYFSGAHSMYGYVKCDEVGTGGYRTFLNVTTASFVNVSGARYVYIFMRDISVVHSYSWGWNVLINLHFYDGVNKYVNNGPSNPHPTMLYYDGQSYPTTNLNNFTLTGQDGQTWYVYRREIPQIIDTSNFNMTILWFANDWTSASGAYCSISSFVDNIFLVTEPTGVLTSKPIEVQDDMRWDSLIINKTEPTNTNIEVTILNALNDQPIPGSAKYVDSGEFDISFIDPVQYPSIKLRANFEGYFARNPKLNYWGVSWNASSAWRESFFEGLKDTKQELISGDGESWLITSKEDWYKYQNNPILTVGANPSWDSVYVSSPSIIYNGTGYMMWYHGNSGSNTQIGLATSSDGKSWTKYSGNPVLSHSPSISWENDRIASPKVIFNGTGYMMWYDGFNQPSTDWESGLTTSSDGINWQKHPNNPVLKTGIGSAWDNHYVKINDVEFDGVIYKAWYTGLAQINPPTQAPYRIGYATSYDGVTWTKYSGNPILQGPMGWYNGLIGMNVIVEHGQYYGWYGYKPTSSGGGNSIHHATSNDGISWVKSSSNPVLQKGSSGAWDDYLVAAPEVRYKDKQYWMYYTGHDGSKQQIGLAFSKFKSNGDMQSDTITLPPASHYDELIINKTEPTGTYMNISILDGSTQQVIPGYGDLRSTSVDISKISPITHPSILIKANVDSTGYATPILFDWSLNWTKNTAPKILNITNCTNLNRTFSELICVNLTDSEEFEGNLTLEIEYMSPSDYAWGKEYLAQLVYNHGLGRWECVFTPPADAELGIYKFRFNCNDSFQYMDNKVVTKFIRVVNNLPIIQNISTIPTISNINRTKPVMIKIKASDIETPEDSLGISIKYKSFQDSTWNSIVTQNIIYSEGYWETIFTPLKTAHLGFYTFNITCNDSDDEVFSEIVVQVSNNRPSQPVVNIVPADPKTTNLLSATVTNANDIETPPGNLEFLYKWYKDDDHVPEFDNSPVIPYDATTKYETWRCEVTLFDGLDYGLAGVDSVFIENSPPELVKDFKQFEMFEDQPVSLYDKLSTIFYDADNDPLIFSAIGQNQITVVIIPENGTIEFFPAKNWYGSEYITIYANDTFSLAAEETVIVIVRPVNDLPEIVQVGGQHTTEGYPVLDFIVYQDDELDLEIKADDIDGDVERDMIKYLINESGLDNLILNNNKISFTPTNDNVGWHFINISITDNNETPIEYISQNIRIYVRNVNDPPSVKITTPVQNQEFKETDIISFECIADDIDLKVFGSGEHLSFQWITNNSEYAMLGSEKNLVNISLPPGFYNITVRVTDSNGRSAYDYIDMIISEVIKDDKSQPRETMQSIYIWIALIIIILLIILSTIFIIIYSQKKKRRMEAQPTGPVSVTGEVLRPVDSYLPITPTSAQLGQSPVVQSTQLATAPAQELLGPIPTAAGVTTATTTAQAAQAQAQVSQLPPVGATITPTVQPGTISAPATIPETVVDQEQQYGIDKLMTPEEKIALLEERLVFGEIDEDVYLSLKAKYEMEAQPYQPAPQLPPALVSTVEPGLSAAQQQQQPIQLDTAPVSEPSTEAVPPEVTASIPVQVTEPSLPPDLPADAYQQPQPLQPPQVPQQVPVPQQPQTQIQPQPPPTPKQVPVPQQPQVQPQIQPQPQVIQQTIQPPGPQIQKQSEPVSQSLQPTTEQQDTTQKPKNQDDD